LILSQQAREAYFEQGYVVVPEFLGPEWLQRMRDAYLSAIERSREVPGSNEWFSLEADHSHENPRIQRIEKIPDQDIEFWEFVVESDISKLAADIVGPDVIYRDSMINVKCPGSGGAVVWHQDLPFYPHTNTSTIQILIALYDIPAEQGPVTIIDGSHKQQIYQHYDDEGNWTGKLKDVDQESINMGDAVTLPCSAGDAIVLHPLTLHSSGINKSESNRPYLIHGMSAADAISYTAMTWGNSHSGELIRGKSARFAHHEDMVIPLPPDWSDGYSSIFEHHRREGSDGSQ
jgi:ectoine hydroxylase-related dioxygenase (phytanoyl-CoA dioxygenase family)